MKRERIVTENATLDDIDLIDTYIKCTSSETISLTLPAVTASKKGADSIIVNLGSGDVTVEGVTIEEGQHGHIVNDGGTSWVAVIGGDNEIESHAESHQNGGSDEISVAGLSGELADAQPPKSHASNHKVSGSDEVDLDELGEPSDNTNLNATTSKHGLLPKLSGDSEQFLNGDGEWGALPNFLLEQGLTLFMPLMSENYEELQDELSNTLYAEVNI